MCLIVCAFYQHKIILHLVMEDINAGSGKLKEFDYRKYINQWINVQFDILSKT